jgi:virulence factor Mce-like protein
MRRVLPIILLAVLVAGGGYLLLGRGGGEELPKYTVELDNAFGLTENAELRVAGVKVGSVKTLRVDRRTARALVDVEVQRDDFGDLRSDATCSVEPQSLIGEYFLDCQPGRSERRLEEDGMIPVERTTGTIPPDLVADIMRRPQREQLQILLSELGAGFATRGPELQESIKRAIPALRETDRVLALLAANRRTLTALTRDSATVLTALADNKRDVRRFVSEARDTATISANRRVELAETIRRLPGFLRELRPTLRDLGTVADRQTPALRDLRASSGQLTTLLERLGPFAEAAGPAVDALGEAAKEGTRAARPARDTVARTRRLGETAKDPATNLRFILEHIDDRKNAVEKSPVSPTGQGFTGLEALLRYPFVQSQAINIFDSRGYTLKLNILPNDCAQYTNAKTARENPERTKRCNAWLGPNQPGVTTPDLTDRPGTASTRAARDDEGPARRTRERGGDADRRAPEAAPQAPGAPSPAPAERAPRRPPAALDGLLDGIEKVVPEVRVPDPTRPAPEGDKAAEDLLDFLLGS